MKITILGTGTSCGVPQIGCNCAVCTSTDPRDRRLRCSAIVDVDGRRILIDCGPDFREQMLGIDFRKLDAVLITHEHYDHVGGLDDLRPYSVFGDVNVYAEQFCVDHLIERIPYCFTPKDKRYPGVPAINLLTIQPHVPIILQDEDNSPVSIFPVRVFHGKLPIVGFRIRNFLYITDMKTIPEDEFAYLEGIDTLVVNGLRHEEHPSHQTIDEAILFSERIGAKQTYIIHMSHHIECHAIEEQKLPENVHLAYDGMSFEV